MTDEGTYVKQHSILTITSQFQLSQLQTSNTFVKGIHVWRDEATRHRRYEKSFSVQIVRSTFRTVLNKLDGTTYNFSSICTRKRGLFQ